MVVSYMGLREDIKYNPFERNREFINEISQKFGYTPRQQALLTVMMPAMIECYESENEHMIQELLREVEMIEATGDTTIYDVVKSKPNTGIEERDNGKKTVTEGELRRASGVHHVDTPLDIDENGEIRIEGKRTNYVAYRTHYESYTIDEVGGMLHELSHALKAQEVPYELVTSEDGTQILTERDGLIVRVYRVFKENGKIVKELLSEIGVGLEEATTVVDEKQMADIVLRLLRENGDLLSEEEKQFFSGIDVNKEFESNSYTVVSGAAERLQKDPILKQSMRRAQLKGDLRRLENEYNQTVGDTESNHWKLLNDRVDELVVIGYDKFANIFDLENWLRENEEREMQVINSIAGEIKLYEEGVATREEVEKATQD